MNEASSDSSIIHSSESDSSSEDENDNQQVVIAPPNEAADVFGVPVQLMLPYNQHLQSRALNSCMIMEVMLPRPCRWRMNSDAYRRAAVGACNWRLRGQFKLDIPPFMCVDAKGVGSTRKCSWELSFARVQGQDLHQISGTQSGAFLLWVTEEMPISSVHYESVVVARKANLVNLAPAKVFRVKANMITCPCHPTGRRIRGTVFPKPSRKWMLDDHVGDFQENNMFADLVPEYDY